MAPQRRSSNNAGASSRVRRSSSRSSSATSRSLLAVLCRGGETAAVPEAASRMTKNGLVVDGEGWFVINARDSRWKDEGPLGSYCTFEGKRRFPHFGINISILQPGERMGMYHCENAQEAFLVLEGECTLIVEGEVRLLGAWDFFYCAPGTEHIIVTSGEQSAVVLAVGGRGRGVGGR